VDLSSEQDNMPGSCEQGNGPSGYIEKWGISLPDERTRVYPKVSRLSRSKVNNNNNNNNRSEATQGVVAAKLTRLTHKTAMQLHLVPENCTTCSSRSRRPVRKLLDTPSYFNFSRPLLRVVSHVPGLYLIHTRDQRYILLSRFQVSLYVLGRRLPGTVYS
jgi:hypothetical protein